MMLTMRIYNSVIDGTVDLDNDELYKNYSNNRNELETKIFANYGYSRLYMNRNNQYKSIFKKQRKELEEFMNNYWNNRLLKSREGNTRWFQEQLYLIIDMNENLC